MWRVCVCVGSSAKTCSIVSYKNILFGSDWEEMNVGRIRRVHRSDSGGAYESEFTDQELWQIDCDDPTYRRLEDELSIIDKYTKSESIGLTGRLILGRQLNDIATKCSETELCPALVQPILSSLPRELRDYMCVTAFHCPGYSNIRMFLLGMSRTCIHITRNIANHIMHIVTI